MFSSFFSITTTFAARVPHFFRGQSSSFSAVRWLFSALLLTCIAVTNSYAQTATCKVTYTKAWEGGHGFGASGAFHDTGEVTWTSDGTTLTIEGAAIFGNTVPITITVPARFGHYSKSFAQVFNVPALGGALPGWAQVQVAP